MLEVIILLIVSILISYFIGKHVGQLRGFAEGKTAMVLILRQKSFEQGRCILCNLRETVPVEESGIATDHSTNNM